MSLSCGIKKMDTQRAFQVVQGLVGQVRGAGKAGLDNHGFVRAKHNCSALFLHQGQLSQMGLRRHEYKQFEENHRRNKACL